MQPSPYYFDHVFVFLSLICVFAMWTANEVIGCRCLQYGPVYDWPTEIHSLILGSFYYGYAVSQLPGGLLASYWKPQHVFGLTISLSGLLCALLPLLASWSVNLVIACRCLMGFLQVCLLYTQFLQVSKT